MIEFVNTIFKKRCTQPLAAAYSVDSRGVLLEKSSIGTRKL